MGPRFAGNPCILGGRGGLEAGSAEASSRGGEGGSRRFPRELWGGVGWKGPKCPLSISSFWGHLCLPSLQLPQGFLDPCREDPGRTGASSWPGRQPLCPALSQPGLGCGAVGCGENE